MNRSERLEVRVGIGSLPNPMTEKQARAWGEKNMPGDLRRAGFQVYVSRSDKELHGGNWWRVAFGKTVKTS